MFLVRGQVWDHVSRSPPKLRFTESCCVVSFRVRHLEFAQPSGRYNLQLLPVQLALSIAPSVT